MSISKFSKIKLVYIVRKEKEWNNFVPTLDFWNAKEIEKTWNRIFNIKYSEFRKILNKIRLDFIPKGFDIYTSTCNSDFIEIINSENCLLVPTDDDDWFVQDFVEIIRSKYIKQEFIRWNYCEYRLGEVMLKTDPYVEMPPYGKPFGLDYSFLTNNYALRTPVDAEYIKSHGSADKFLCKNKNYIKESLSMCNKSIASLSLINRWTNNYFFYKNETDTFDIYNKKCIKISKENFIKTLPNSLIDLYERTKKKPVQFRDCDDIVPVFFQNMINIMQDTYDKLKINNYKFL